MAGAFFQVPALFVFFQVYVYHRTWYPHLSANFVDTNGAPLFQKSHKSVSFCACFLSEHHLARTSFNYVPLLCNGSRSIEGLIRTSRISCKTHKGSQEDVALNSPFIGQQIRPKNVILKWKMMFYAEFFKPCLSDNPVQKELRTVYFRVFFSLGHLCLLFPLPSHNRLLEALTFKVTHIYRFNPLDRNINSTTKLVHRPMVYMWRWFNSSDSFGRLLWPCTIQYNIFYLNTVKVKAYAAYGAVLQC